MTHEIFKKDCLPKVRMAYCLGYMHSQFAERRKLYGICTEVSKKVSKYERKISNDTFVAWEHLINQRLGLIGSLYWLF